MENVSIESYFYDENEQFRTNSTNETDISHSDPIIISILTVANYIFLTAGGSANFLLIVVILTQCLWGLQEFMLVLNLSTADFFLCLPYDIIGRSLKSKPPHCCHETYFRSSVVDKLILCLENIFVCASNYSEVVIAVDRCCVTSHRMSIVRGIGKTTVKLALSAVWIISTLTGICLAVFTNEAEMALEELKCDGFQTGINVFKLIQITITYFVPFVLLIISNLKIRRRVARRRFQYDTVLDESIKKQYEETLRKLDARIAAETISFIVCSFPLSSFPCLGYTLFLYFGGTEATHSEFPILLTRVLESLGSCINPVLHGFLNAVFRHSLKKMVYSIICKKSNGSISRSSRKDESANTDTAFNGNDSRLNHDDDGNTKARQGKKKTVATPEFV